MSHTQYDPLRFRPWLSGNFVPALGQLGGTFAAMLAGFGALREGPQPEPPPGAMRQDEAAGACNNSGRGGLTGCKPLIELEEA